MRLLISAAIGILVYVIWYGVTTGQYCSAMWFGSAPPVIIFIAAATCYRLLGQRQRRS